MNKKLKIGIGGLLVVLLSAFMVGGALAQDDTTTPTVDPDSVVRRGHRPGGRYWFGDAGMEAVADILGMTTDELSTALHDGQTLEELAEAVGTDVDTLEEAAQAANDQAVRDTIEQSVEDGTRTREHADWLLEGLDKGYISGHDIDGHKMGRMEDRDFSGEMMPFGESGRFHKKSDTTTEEL